MIRKIPIVPAAPRLSPKDYVRPIIDMQGIKPGAHFVQFYDRDLYLAQSVAAFVAEGLSLGNACVVVATRDHRAAFAAKLAAADIDVDDCRKKGLYSEYDAAVLLSRFMVNGQPDHHRVRAALGPVIEKAAEAGVSGVRIYGEMVALLWAQGNKLAAIELEILWNELAEIYSFTLMCGYPMAGFSDDERSNQLRHICRAHSHVLPHESYSLQRPYFTGF